jgi:microcystin-dependent protein
MDPYLGEIRIFAGNYAPVDWMMCRGQPLIIADYPGLFSLLGTNYGGDGVTTFNLPDFRGRAPLGVGSGFALGQQGGAESVALTADNLPSHSHAGKVKCANRSDSESPTGNVPGTAILTSSSAPRNRYVPDSGQDLVDLSSNCASIDAAGGSQPHSNIQPSLVLNFIIAVQGIYPSRD